MAWPDTLRLLIAYLTPRLAPVPVMARVPQDTTPRGPLVQLRRVGGAALPPVRDTVRVDVFAWHQDEVQATQLAFAAREHLWALDGTSLLTIPCYRVSEFMGPRSADDGPSGVSRVWATYEFDVRADLAIRPARR